MLISSYASYASYRSRSARSAWIEIFIATDISPYLPCRAPHGARGLKLVVDSVSLPAVVVVALRTERVD